MMKIKYSATYFMIYITVLFFGIIDTSYAEENNVYKVMVKKEIMNIDTSLFTPSCIQISPDGKHVAYIAKSKTKSLLMVDGKETKQYETVYFMVVDSNLGKQYNNIALGKYIFSPDSKRFAYVALIEDKSGDKNKDKRIVVVDGKEGKPYDGIGQNGPVFSPDSKHVAYAAREGKKWFVVEDGKEGKPYDGILDSTPVFSADSNHLAYAALINKLFGGNQCFTVVDGVEGKKYTGIGKNGLGVSTDGKRLAYIAFQGKECFLVVDDHEGKPYVEEKEYDAIGSGRPVFSPDGNHLAYVGTYVHKQKDSNKAKQDNKYLVIVDGKTNGKYYDLVGGSNVVFSPDSKHFAFVANIGDKYFVVKDWNEEKLYKKIAYGYPVFSPDSNHLAYLALSSGNNWSVVVDGKEGKGYNSYDNIEGGRITFESPDEFHYFFLIGENHVYFIQEKILEKKE